MNSRQWLRRAALESPGGKKVSLVEETLDQQDREQLALNPGARRCVAALGDVAETKQGFQALEGALSLPSRNVLFSPR
jgi:hypothetical protein